LLFFFPERCIKREEMIGKLRYLFQEFEASATGILIRNYFRRDSEQNGMHSAEHFAEHSRKMSRF